MTHQPKLVDAMPEQTLVELATISRTAHIVGSNAMVELSKALHKRADELRERAIIADQQRGGSVPDEIVDRWASSFATAYQTLRGAAFACADTAAALSASNEGE